VTAVRERRVTGSARSPHTPNGGRDLLTVAALKMAAGDDLISIRVMRGSAAMSVRLRRSEAESVIVALKRAIALMDRGE
jgi:hypothetical protein